VSNYVLHNATPASDLPTLISSTHAILARIEDGAAEDAPDDVVKPTSAQIRKSITYDALISFEDGRRYKTLKRHLTTHGITAAEYRIKWSLPDDYPMTAQAFSEARSNLAKALGFGQAASKLTKATKKQPAKSQRPRP
jgi:predicted transcriptional regulator